MFPTPTFTESGRGGSSLEKEGGRSSALEGNANGLKTCQTEESDKCHRKCSFPFHFFHSLTSIETYTQKEAEARAAAAKAKREKEEAEAKKRAEASAAALAKAEQERAVAAARAEQQRALAAVQKKQEEIAAAAEEAKRLQEEAVAAARLEQERAIAAVKRKQEEVLQQSVQKIVAEAATEPPKTPQKDVMETTLEAIQSSFEQVTYPAVISEDELNSHPDRRSVDTILRDSKAAAVEEWHRSKTVEKEVTLEEKVQLMENRLVDEIRAGPSTGLLNYVDLLEKIGEQQRTTTTTTTSSSSTTAAAETKSQALEPKPQGGRWDLAYSSRPISPFFALPQWLTRFLVGLSATVEFDGKAVVYRAIFKFFDWFPKLRRTQRVTVQAVSPHKSVEKFATRPRFTLGRWFSFLTPKFLWSKSHSSQDPPKVVNTCTYLGSKLKICRIAQSPAVGGMYVL